MSDLSHALLRRAVGAPLHPPPSNPGPDPFNVEIPVEPGTPSRRHPSEPPDPNVEDPFSVDLPVDRAPPPPSIH